MMQKGQFLLLASLMTVASFLGGTLASIVVLNNTKKVIETPALYFVDEHNQRIGGVGFNENGKLRIMHFKKPTNANEHTFVQKD